LDRKYEALTKYQASLRKYVYDNKNAFWRGMGAADWKPELQTEFRVANTESVDFDNLSDAEKRSWLERNISEVERLKQKVTKGLEKIDAYDEEFKLNVIKEMQSLQGRFGEVGDLFVLNDDFSLRSVRIDGDNSFQRVSDKVEAFNNRVKALTDKVVQLEKERSEIDILKGQLQVSTQQVNELEKKRSDQQALLEFYQKEKNALLKQVSDSQKDLARKEKEAENERQLETKTRRKLNAAVAEKKEKIRGLEDNIKMLTDKLNQLNAEVASLHSNEKEIVKLNQNITKKDREIASLRDSLVQEKKIIESQASDIAQKNNEIGLKNDALNSARKEIEEKIATLETSRRELQKLSQQVADQKSRIEGLQSHLGDGQKKLEQAQKQLADAKVQERLLRDDLGEKGKRLEILQTQYEQAQKTSRDYQLALEEKKGQLDHFKSLASSLEHNAEQMGKKAVDLEQKLGDEPEKVVVLKAKLAQQLKEIEDKGAELERTKALLERKNNAAQVVSSENTRLAHEVSELKAQVEQTKKQLAMESEALSDVNARLLLAQQEKKGLESEMEIGSSTLLALEDSLALAKSETQALHSSLEAKQQEMEILVSEYEEAKRQVELELEDQINQLKASIKAKLETEQWSRMHQEQVLKAKYYAQGSLSAMALLTMASPQVNDRISANISKQTKDSDLFIHLSTGHDSYSASAGFEDTSWTLTTGAFWRSQHLMAAAFVEGAGSDYTVNASWSDATGFTYGDMSGHNSYAGVGIYLRLQEELLQGAYTEATLRGGRINTRLGSKTGTNATIGDVGGFGVQRFYSSAHLGLGYVFQVARHSSLDMKLQYLWGRIEDAGGVENGHAWKFDQITSQRLRLTGMLDHRLQGGWHIRGGAGYEYEFDGKATATLGSGQMGNVTQTASLHGGTTLLLAGVTLHPAGVPDLSVSFDVMMSRGQRKGVRADVQLNYLF